MAQASVELIDALRQTARRIEAQTTANSETSVTGICNQLIQALAGRTAAKLKLYFRKNSWQQIISDKNTQAGNLLRKLKELGLSRTDLSNLENLSDPEVLAHIRQTEKDTARNPEHFAAIYLRAWAGLLEKQLLATLGLPVDIGYLRMAA